MHGRLTVISCSYVQVMYALSRERDHFRRVWTASPHPWRSWTSVFWIKETRHTHGDRESPCFEETRVSSSRATSRDSWRSTISVFGGKESQQDAPWLRRVLAGSSISWFFKNCKTRPLCATSHGGRSYSKLEGEIRQYRTCTFRCFVVGP